MQSLRYAQWSQSRWEAWARRAGGTGKGLLGPQWADEVPERCFWQGEAHQPALPLALAHHIREIQLWSCLGDEASQAASVPWGLGFSPVVEERLGWICFFIRSLFCTSPSPGFCIVVRALGIDLGEGEGYHTF
jgi:hypothetical protein